MACQDFVTGSTKLVLVYFLLRRFVVNATCCLRKPTLLGITHTRGGLSCSSNLSFQNASSVQIVLVIAQVLPPTVTA
jgi:hypothetical protein